MSIELSWVVEMTISKIVKLISLYILLLFPEIHLIAGEVLTVGVFPRRNSVITVNMFSPMIAHLERKTGYTIRLETAKNFPEFWKQVKKERYDIVHFNQLHYILSHDELGYEVFAKNEEFNRSKIASAILVRKDSGINTIADLKYKTIIFGGGKLALIANVGNRLILRENGLKRLDYRASYAKNPPNATLSVFYKRADAAGVGDTALDINTVRRNIDTSELKYLVLGEEHPHIPWAFATRVKKDIRDKISGVLLQLSNSKKGKAVLKKAGLTDLVSSQNREYDQTREIYKIYLDNADL